MGWIWLSVALASLVAYTQGQQGYNYHPPQKAFDGGSTATTTPGFTPNGYASSTTAGYPLPTGGYPGNGQRPSNGRSGGYPGQNGGYTTAGYPRGPNGFPSTQPTGYPVPGRPSGPSFPPAGQPSFQRPTTGGPEGPSVPGQAPGPSGYPSAGRPSGTPFQPGGSSDGYSGTQGPTGGFGVPGQTPSQSGYPAATPGGSTGGYGVPGQTPSPSGYPGAAPGGTNGGPRPTNGFQRPGAHNGFERPVEGHGESQGFPGEQQPSEEGEGEGDYSAIPGQPDIDYPILSEIPETSFRCDEQQYPGYYADVETRCQVFHICANNKTYDFLCPNGTIFHQEYLVCVWWNQFDCNSAPSLYAVNENIYDYSIAGQQNGGPGAATGYPSGEQGGEPVSGYQPGAEGNGYPSGRPTGPGITSSTPLPGQGYPSNGQRPNGYPSGEPQSSTQTPGSYSGNGRSQTPEYLPPRPGQQSGNGYPSGQRPGTGYPSGQPSNGGEYSNGNGRIGGQPNREYLPPYQQ